MSITLITADGSTEHNRIPTGVRYVLGQGGLYVQRNSALFVSCVKGDVEMPSLQKVNQGVMLRTPPIPLSMLNQAVAFFEHVYKEYRSEAALVLTYDIRTKQYEWYCPLQDAVGMNVKFNYPLDLPPGKLSFGDFHSHPNMGPTPSFVDEEDEKYRDGIHLIAGYVGGGTKWYGGKDHERDVELSATFTVDGGRISMDPYKVCEDLPEKPYGDFPHEWFERVTHKPYQYEKKDWKNWKERDYYAY